MAASGSSFNPTPLAHADNLGKGHPRGSPLQDLGRLDDKKVSPGLYGVVGDRLRNSEPQSRDMNGAVLINNFVSNFVNLDGVKDYNDNYRDTITNFVQSIPGFQECDEDIET
ncbi:hypothetical protein TNCV_245781 [Trichonephila clavipes]|nr:hypothetical protein TNCV_245781 [Trichonephila clavipes]